MPSAKARYSGLDYKERLGTDRIHPYPLELDLSVLRHELRRLLPDLRWPKPLAAQSIYAPPARLGSRRELAAACAELRRVLMGIARSAAAELADQEDALTKQEIQAEHKNLKATLNKAAQKLRRHGDLIDTLATTARKLRRISRSHGQFLPDEFDALALADQMDGALKFLEGAMQLDGYRKFGAEKYEADVAKDMSFKVRDALEARGIEVNATAPSPEEFPVARDVRRGREDDERVREQKAQTAFGKTSAVVKLLKAIGEAVRIERELTVWQDILLASRQKPSAASE